jgi:hypothetical protein
MPEPSPPAAAAAYIERIESVGKGLASATGGSGSSSLNNGVKKGKKSLNVVMLGNK